jgi:signal transduction histidine kinase
LPPPDILGEPPNLTRVFHNLLDNAIKYTPKRRDNVIVEVIDNGRGIPANELEQVWEELYRASNAGNGGSGMGLALVRIAVERHGGERSIERLEPPQNGTRVILSFPAASAADAHQPGADRAAQPSIQAMVPAPASETPPAQPLEDAIGDTPRTHAESG